MEQFIFTCPFCKQQFYTSDEMSGQSANCPNCGSVIIIQKQMQSVNPVVSTHDLPRILGILSLILWIIPLFGLPISITGFVMSSNRRYQMGITLNAIGLGLSILCFFVYFVPEL